MNKVKSRGAESGQSLLLTVLVMAVLIGFTAMAIDVGLLLENRRKLQNSADAMALAGVQELPVNPLGAKQKARQWAANNGIKPAQIKNIEIQTKFFPNDTIYVEVDEQFDWIFARVLGMSADTVTGDAAARVGTLASAQNQTVPWALLYGQSSCLDPQGYAVLNATCSVQVGATDPLYMGWRGALDFDKIGGGSAEYKSNIIDGTTDTVYCLDGSVSPVPPECQSSTVYALDGSHVGPTGRGIDDRLAAGAECDINGNGKDDFDEVFVKNPQPSSTYYAVNCPSSPWLVMIPIVSADQIPVSTVTIEGWALAYLLGYKCVGGAGPNCIGMGHWEVQVQIVDATYTAARGYLTEYNPLAGITVRRLVQ